jgi:hypothetical protein
MSNALTCYFHAFLEQNVKAYLRRGTAREILGYYKKAIDGLSLSLSLSLSVCKCTLQIFYLTNPVEKSLWSI